MLRKGRASANSSDKEPSKFMMAKAMILATTEFKQRDGINSAASYLMDGHSVELSEELVEQKPSIVRSKDWDTVQEPQTAPASASTNAGIIRVCWQCPEVSTVFDLRNK